MKGVFISLLLISASTNAIGEDELLNSELAFYDSELNEAYQSILHELSPEHQIHLRNAQRSWLKMRDSDCSWSFADRRDCVIDRTVRRTAELKESFFTSKSGLYKSLSPANGQ